MLAFHLNRTLSIWYLLCLRACSALCPSFSIAKFKHNVYTIVLIVNVALYLMVEFVYDISQVVVQPPFVSPTNVPLRHISVTVRPI